MDWSKTKIFLIVALLVTNIMLGYFYFVDQLSNNSGISDEEELQEVVSLLEQRNIKMAAPLENYSREYSEVEVQVESYDLVQLKDKFFSESGYKVVKNGDVGYSDGVSDLKVDERNYLIYELRDARQLEENTTTVEDAQTIAELYIKYLGFDLESIYLEAAKEENDYVLIEYTQLENGMFIKDSKMIIKINKNQVIHFSRRWREIINVTPKGNRMISVGKALFSVMEDIYRDKPSRKDKMVIERVYLEYTFPKGSSSVQMTDFSEGTIVPYWIIETDRGKYSVEALEK